MCVSFVPPSQDCTQISPLESITPKWIIQSRFYDILFLKTLCVFVWAWLILCFVDFFKKNLSIHRSKFIELPAVIKTTVLSSILVHYVWFFLQNMKLISVVNVNYLFCLVIWILYIIFVYWKHMIFQNFSSNFYFPFFDQMIVWWHHNFFCMKIIFVL